MKKYENLTRLQQEEFLLPLILQELKNMGGNGSTTEIKKSIVSDNDDLPEDLLLETKISTKGNSYHPFDFVYNFAVKNLYNAKYIDRPKRGYIRLTSKGYNFNGTVQELILDVYPSQINVDNNAEVEDEESEKIIKDNISQEDENTAKITNAINKLSPQKFETFCRALMKKMNVDIDEKIGVQMSNDGGLDGFGYMLTDDFRTTRVAIQAKHWNQNNLVSSPEIDKFRGAMDKYRAEYGVFITTSNFTRSATKAARTGSRVITLIDGDQLTKLVIKYHLYVKPVITYELNKDFFGDGKD